MKRRLGYYYGCWDYESKNIDEFIIAYLHFLDMNIKFNQVELIVITSQWDILKSDSF